MQLNDNDFSYLCDRAILAAKQAGELIESYANKTVSIKHKQGGDSYASQVVTEVDLLSEAIIVKILKPTCERYDLGLLTEEGVDDKSRLEKDYFWCVDPMDGTLSFIESIPGYAVSIALVSQSGEALIGVIYDPVTHTLYSAVKGQGAFVNGKPWDVSSELVSVDSKSLTLVCDRGFTEKSDYTQINQAIELMARKRGLSGLRTIEKNGAVLNACWVLQKPPALYVKLPKPEEGGGSLWDFAATAALFIELNYFASDFYGQPLDLNRADSTFMNHRGVLFTTDQSLVADTVNLRVGPERTL